MKTGTELIADERTRQIEKEGWDSFHDESHTDMCLSTAAASYALDVAASKHSEASDDWKRIFKDYSTSLWPFDFEWFKPTPEDPVRQLVKAGALIAAEIDRINRTNPKASTVNVDDWIEFIGNEDLFDIEGKKNCMCKFDDDTEQEFDSVWPIAKMTHFKTVKVYNPLDHTELAPG